jgi:putative NADH-flavin reductase
MKVAIFGSTGGTGRELVKQALAAGHEVTAFARSSDSGLCQGPLLRIVTGGITDPVKVELAIKGQQAVLSALGAKGKIRICAPGTSNILAAMHRLGVRRLLAVSAFGAAESHDRSLYSRLLWLAIHDRMEDKDEMERLIQASDLEWTLVRPPALTNGKKRGRYRVGTTLRMSVFSKISRADVAHFMLNELAVPRFIQQCPAIVI